MTVVFWTAAALVAYVYVGYPVLLYCGLWIAECGLFKRPQANPQANPQSAIRDPQLPASVSIVLCARNEGPRLPARIDNLLSLDYPAHRRQIIVVSDGSTDDTLDVLSTYGNVVDVIAIPPSGKAIALNAGVAAARFDLLVFADARQVFAPDALRELTAPFGDPAVGGVTGELLLDCESALFSDRRDR